MRVIRAVKWAVARCLNIATDLLLAVSQRLLSRRAFAVWQRTLKALNTRFNWRFRRQKLADAWASSFLTHSPMFSFHVETTNVCNAKCVFCAYPQMERPKTIMKMPLFEKIVAEIGQQSRRGDVSFTPIVGDPFVDPKLLDRVKLLYPMPQVRTIEFYTNAIRMRPVAIDSLVPYSDKVKIAVSWGGFDAPTWNEIMGVKKFDVARAHLDYLIQSKRERGARFQINLALRCPDSALKGPLWEKYKALEQAGVIGISNIVQFDSWAGKISGETLDRSGLVPRPMPHKLGPCKLLYYAPVILADGRVNACACRDVEAELVIGDVTQESFFSIFGGPRHRELIQRQMDGDWPDVCKRCTFYVSTHDNIRTFV